MIDKIINYCIPLAVETPDEIKPALGAILESSPDYIEFRRDYYRGGEEEAMAFLEDIGPGLIYTYRSPDEGGKDTEVTESERFESIQRAIESGIFDYVDLERASKVPRELFEAATERGVGIIQSHHDFEATPKLEEVLECLTLAPECQVVKAAFTCRGVEDLKTLIKAQEIFHDCYPETPLILIAMGERGQISRILPELFGSCLTFCSDAVSSAPGQLSINEVKKRRRLLGYD